MGSMKLPECDEAKLICSIIESWVWSGTEIRFRHGSSSLLASISLWWIYRWSCSSRLGTRSFPFYFDSWSHSSLRFVNAFGNNPSNVLIFFNPQANDHYAFWSGFVPILWLFDLYGNYNNFSCVLALFTLHCYLSFSSSEILEMKSNKECNDIYGRNFVDEERG